MSHRRSTQYFGRKFNARKALFRGLISSLVEHERIKTTVDKAKELRRHVEKAITLGKKNDLATRRVLLARVPQKVTVDKILSNLSVRFKDTAGGYTRIIRIGARPGDCAEMAFIEFIDFDYKQTPEQRKAATAGQTAVADKPAKKAKGKVLATKKAKAGDDAAETAAKPASGASGASTTAATKNITRAKVRTGLAARKNRRQMQSKSRAHNRPS